MTSVCHSPAQDESHSAAFGPTDCRPHIWRFAELDSTQDTAFRLAAKGWLPVWHGVQACSQTAGRGQLRRQWQSPVGNIYASLRLPVAPPFDSSAAAPATALLLAEALRALGWPVWIKWPNDLVLLPSGTGGRPRKVAGVLLEERGSVLLAGVGLNVRYAPSDADLRADAAMSATCLAACGHLWGAYCQAGPEAAFRPGPAQKCALEWGQGLMAHGLEQGQSYTEVCGAAQCQTGHRQTAEAGQGARAQVLMPSGNRPEMLAERPSASGLTGRPETGPHRGPQQLLAEDVWQHLVKLMYSIYSSSPTFPEHWRSGMEALLLWRGRRVELLDDESSVCGLLQGISPAGGLMLASAHGVREFFSGSLRLCAGGISSD